MKRVCLICCLNDGELIFGNYDFLLFFRNKLKILFDISINLLKYFHSQLKILTKLHLKWTLKKFKNHP